MPDHIPQTRNPPGGRTAPGRPNSIAPECETFQETGPRGERGRVLDALVELVHAYRPFGGGPHLSGGTVGLAPIVRALHAGGRDDVLHDVLQKDTRLGYGCFMAPTTANPHGLTTVPEQWDMGNSKNHMILLQIEEWIHSGLVGIRLAPGSAGYRELLIDPRPIGGLTRAEGSYHTPCGEVSARWLREKGRFRLDVELPPNTTAHVRVPTGGRKAQVSGDGAVFQGVRGDRAAYGVASGRRGFVAYDGDSQ
jgi:alpha-L-rhamnosidase